MTENERNEINKKIQITLMKRGGTLFDYKLQLCIDFCKENNDTDAKCL